MKDEQRGTGSMVEVRKQESGFGVFARVDLQADDWLFDIHGTRLMNFNATTHLNDKESYCLQTGIDQYLFLSPVFCYCNHSCDPNCGVRNGSALYTIKSIKAGEELRWDYSTSMLERHWNMHCECGSFNCRKRIGDFDLLPPSLQRKYLQLGVVMPFIAQLYETAPEPHV